MALRTRKNVGGTDRIARALIAVVFLAIGVGALVTTGVGTIAIVGLVAGTSLGLNAATQFCLANALLGIDTCSWDGAE